MRRALLALTALALTASLAVPIQAPLAAKDKITDAQAMAVVLANPARDADRVRDAHRHPAETLAFFKVRPGMTVVDYMPSGGWFTRVLVPYLGTSGRYIGLNPDVRNSTDGMKKAYSGLHDAWVHVDAAGTSRCVQVNLTPLGALRLLGLPMRELVNRSTPMDALPVAHELQLSEQLHEATGWEARFAMIERALLRRLARARAVPSLVEAAWHRMWDAGGVIDVAQLSRSLGCGRRHLGAMVQEHAGLPPTVRHERWADFDAGHPSLEPPPTWTGFAVIPREFTFWRGDPDGPSQRVRFRRATPCEEWNAQILPG